MSTNFSNQNLPETPNVPTDIREDINYMPDEQKFRRGLSRRNTRGGLWRLFFSLSTVVALLALVALFFNIINSAFGYVASTFRVDPDSLIEGGDVTTATTEQLAGIIYTQNINRARVLIRDNASVVANNQFTTLPISQVLAGKVYPESAAEKTIPTLTEEETVAILAGNVPNDLLLDFVAVQLVGERVVETWTLSESVFNRASIDAYVAESDENEEVYFRSWIRPSFITSRQSSDVILAGTRTALIGTIWIVAITVLISFPIGVGAAIYLEEYAPSVGGVGVFGRALRWFNKIIETNIRNLAGVPSIIYGLLGLAIFVRLLVAITGGRTILSASLTMALLILPVIIINSQESIRAVPSSIREASFGLGATRWQTIWNQVLPAALPGILTGTILGMSRAIGETAPLVVIGAATTILIDPNGPLSAFTALPIQIYQWTSRPQGGFASIAAAAIIVLLILLLSLNASAIFLRQYFKRRLQA